MLTEQILRIVRTVKILTLGVLAGASVIAADDEMRAAVVLADQPMPHGLARPGHAHGKVQKAHCRGGLGILVQNGLVAPNAGEVVHVAGFGHTDDRMDQQVGLRLFRGAEGQFLMRAVQRIAGLECDHLTPAQLAEIGAQFIRRVTATTEIVVYGLLDTCDRTTQIDLARLVVQVVHRRVGVVIRAKDLFRLARLVRHPAVSHGHRAKDHTFLIAQGNILTDLEVFCECFGHVKSNRHRPERTVCKAHLLDDAVVILFAQEPLERVEPAIHQEFEIANLARRQIVADKVCCFQFQLLRTVIGNE